MVSMAADALGNRDGAEFMDLKNHSPIWTAHEVPTKLMKEAFPCLVESKKCVDENMKKRMKKILIDCLKSAQCCLLAIDLLIRSFVQMSASRVKADE